MIGFGESIFSDVREKNQWISQEYGTKRVAKLLRTNADLAVYIHTFLVS